MDETATAFEMSRFHAEATPASAVPDRLSVRDYTRDVEIGAFGSERGVTQRIRFNVVLEVSYDAADAASRDDDVDRIISYDTIADAIEAELATERVNLLETLAERIAARCLNDPRAARVFVRIEKLDRGPGALGVEIMRASGHDPLRTEAPTSGAPRARARVVYLGANARRRAADWYDALARDGVPTVICVGPAMPVPPARSEASRRIGLLAIEQAAWALSEREPRLKVVTSRTELDWAMKAGRMAVWAPTRMVMDAVGAPAPDADDPVALAVWLGTELGPGVDAAGAAGIAPLVAGDDVPEAPSGLRVIRISSPGDLAGVAGAAVG